MGMELIIAIVAASLFVLLLIVYIIVAVRKHKIEVRRKAEYREMFKPDAEFKADYDVVYGDDESPLTTLFEGKQEDAEGGESEAEENSFSIIDSEGVEEITGNYKPEND